MTAAIPWLRPTTLQGHALALEPLALAHAAELSEATRDGSLWRLPYTSVPDPAGMDAYLEEALAMQAAGTALPFAIRLEDGGHLVGSTRFCHAEPAHRRVEIGYTWLAESVQRSFVNTACKLLLLGHAFDELKALAVEFRTHRLNRASRRAIERLGAQQDGILRQHRIEPDGTLRDTVVFSILDHEWAAVRKGLREDLRILEAMPRERPS
ncbi:MAG: GNAT family N-acetyltransferase [Planctomycetota bacterium]